MKMLTKKITDILPKLYSQEKIKDPICYLKYFCPWNSWTWYVTEGEPVNFKCNNCTHEQERLGTECESCGSKDLKQQGNDWLFFGKVVNNQCPDGELGYTLLSQLEEIVGPAGLKIERDLHWKPTLLSKCS